MYIRTTFAAALTAIILLSLPGCAVQRGQETVGNYVDDAGITTMIKARFIESKLVSAGAINVETMKGTVVLSGFAKDLMEKSAAENIARNAKNVVMVQNDITIRP
jgi:hyperosmotically inducible protein